MARYREQREPRQHVQVDPVPLPELLAQVLAHIKWRKECGENKLMNVWLLLKRPKGGTLVGYYLPSTEEKAALSLQLRELGYTLENQPDSARTYPKVDAQTNIYWSS